ncbi:hypothetical protein SAMN05880593_1247 [Rhizobium sp. RU36D]|nr:hypothetical protein SAMN05880593_1247 [Rhizobium sp. RU36D]
MYSYADRLRAVELYIRLGKRLNATIRQLGYAHQECAEGLEADTAHGLLSAIELAGTCSTTLRCTKARNANICATECCFRLSSRSR